MYLDPGMCGVIFAGVVLRFGGSFLGEISNTTRPDTSMSGYSGRVLKCTCFRTQGWLGERRFRFTGELTVSTYSQLVIKHRGITHARWACIAPSWQDLLPVGDWASPPTPVAIGRTRMESGGEQGRTRLTARTWKTRLQREGGEGGNEIVNIGGRIIDRKLLCANRNVETLDRGSKRLCHHRSDSIDLLRSDGPDLEWFNSVRSSDSKPLVNEEECKEVEDCKSREGRHGGSVELVSSLEIKA